MDIVLEGIVGSRAFGTATAESDTDYLGVFVMPNEELLGIYPPGKNLTFTDASPEGDDHTYHEIGKIFGLWLKANPTQLDLLFLDEYSKCSETGVKILENRDLFLSEKYVKSCAKGFISGMIKLNTPKSIFHGFRVYRNTMYLLRYGEYSVRADSQLEIGKLSKDALALCVPAIDDIPSVLHWEPDYGKVNDLLLDIRLGDK